MSSIYRFQMNSFNAFHFNLSHEDIGINVNVLGELNLVLGRIRSSNFVDAKRRELVCITLGSFLNSASGNGI